MPLVNDKYQIPPIISVSKPLAKIVIIVIIVILIIWYIYRNIFHPPPPSRSLNSKPDYSHRMTASDNLFSGIYKPTMNEQSEVNYRGEEIFYPIYRNYCYGFPIRHTKKPRERNIAEQAVRRFSESWLIEPTTYETLPYGYG